MPYGVISIIQKSSFVRNQFAGFFQFIEQFIFQGYNLIYEEDCPRVCQELQDTLHPTIKQQVGDLILYKDFIVIRVYGAEKQPYKLPKFLTPRIFGLEILRQRFDSDYVHFTSRNQAGTFKLLVTIGPFTIRNMNATKIIEEIMVCFQFEEDIACQYDPLGIIQEKRRKLKRGACEHTGIERMSKLANKLTFSDEDELDSEDTQIEKSLALVSVHEKGKRPSSSEKTSPASEKKKVKTVKLSKEPPFHILEHFSPNIMMIKGEVTTT